jgi:hypothetical protein
LALSISAHGRVLWMIRAMVVAGETDGGADMKVLLTFYGEEKTDLSSSPEEIARTFQTWGEFGEAAGAAGVLIACEGLEGRDAATTIRVQRDGRQMTDGPFMETKEQLGGFALLEVRDLDEALEWAARTPWNDAGHVTEIRPVMDYDRYAARLGEAAAS